MARSHPPAADLLEVVRDFLDAEVLPSLSGDRRFQCRVAINVLGIVARELRLGPEAARGARDRLRALLGVDGSLDALTRVLATGLRDGTVDLDAPALRTHLVESLREALRVNNPAWLEEPRD